jgi:AcrR family transcriptional regulator
MLMNMEPVMRNHANTEARRRQILAQAVGLVGERGFYGFTIQELGLRCGLSKPGLLHYFPSKQAVLLAVLQELEWDEMEFMLPLVQSVTHDAAVASTQDAVLHVLRTIVMRAADRPEMCLLMAGLQAESLDPAHPAHAWFTAYETNVLKFFAGLLQPFFDAPELVARQMLAMRDGLCIQWLRAGRSFDVVDAWDRALARLLPELHDTAPDPDRLPPHIA